jgi:hypothetical protein
MKLIKTRNKTTNATYRFNIGELVCWTVCNFDGCTSVDASYTGTIIRINKRTIDVMDRSGYVWRGEPRELKKVKL